ncbi:MAG: hypothetical protein AMJ56_21830, partial [Anaerolineae bacterium SG8_19]
MPDEQIKETLAALRQKQVSLKAELKGSGAIAEGEGATAVGERGIFVGKSAGIAISGDNNSVQAIVHVYQESAKRSPDPELLRHQIASYLTW